MFKKFSLKQKILFAVSLTSILVGFSGVAVYRNVNSMIQSQNRVTQTVEVIQQYKGLLELMVDMETGQRGYLMSGDESFLGPYNKATKAFESRIVALQKKVSDNPVQMKRLSLIHRLKEKWLKVAVEHEKASRIRFDKGLISRIEFENSLREAKGKAVMQALRKEIAAGVAMEGKLNVERKKENVRVASSTVNWIVYGLTTSLLLGCLVLFFVSFELIKRVGEVLHGLSDTSDRLNSFSKMIDESSQSLSDGVMNQSSLLVETSSSMDEIGQMITTTSGSADRAGERSKESKKITEQGKATVDKMICAVNEIQNSNQELSSQVQSSNASLTQIIEVIQEIGSKTRVINDIVFQTKLLSFNASVEAARAGEHGKGFAVVAEEIGNLARMSGDAASTISSMLGESIQSVEKIIETTKGSVEHLVNQSQLKVEEGIQVARQCDAALQEILVNVGETDKLTADIVVAAKEQSIGVGEVTKAMHTLNQVTDKSSSIASSNAEISTDLQKQILNLNVLVRDLEGAVNGVSADVEVSSATTPQEISQEETQSDEFTEAA